MHEDGKARFRNCDKVNKTNDEGGVGIFIIFYSNKKYLSLHGVSLHTHLFIVFFMTICYFLFC